METLISVSALLGILAGITSFVAAFTAYQNKMKSEHLADRKIDIRVAGKHILVDNNASPEEIGKRVLEAAD